MFVLLAALEWYRWYMAMKPQPVAFSLVALAVALFGVWRIRRVWPGLKRLRLARDGELVVGQYLEHLRESGTTSFTILWVSVPMSIAVDRTRRGFLRGNEDLEQAVRQVR